MYGFTMPHRRRSAAGAAACIALALTSLGAAPAPSAEAGRVVTWKTQSRHVDPRRVEFGRAPLCGKCTPHPRDGLYVNVWLPDGYDGTRRFGAVSAAQRGWSVRLLASEPPGERPARHYRAGPRPRPPGHHRDARGGRQRPLRELVERRPARRPRVGALSPRRAHPARRAAPESAAGPALPRHRGLLHGGVRGRLLREPAAGLLRNRRRAVGETVAPRSVPLCPGAAGLRAGRPYAAALLLDGPRPARAGPQPALDADVRERRRRPGLARGAVRARQQDRRGQPPQALRAVRQRGPPCARPGHLSNRARLAQLRPRLAIVRGCVPLDRRRSRATVARAASELEL